MIPVDEINEECGKCKHLDYGYGCVPTYNNELPPCGRNVVINGAIVTQEDYKKSKGEEMKKYIGTKLIEAKPMTRGDYNKKRGWTIPENENPEDAGYFLKYPDGYVSWSPAEVFENAYLQIDDNENLPSGVSIGQKMVDEFISYIETTTMGDRTTVVHCVLRNGFEIVQSYSCVDSKNYSQKMGEEICMEKIKDEICRLLCMELSEI